MTVARKAACALMALVFLAGLGVSLYPLYRGMGLERDMQADADRFDSRYSSVESPAPPDSSLPAPESPGEPEPSHHRTLWREMKAYNRRLAAESQSGLSGPEQYERASFSLEDYGLADDVFCVLTIPRLELRMPVRLGASRENMSRGAAHLSQTSLPIGGADTNAVIAGHRGWFSAAYFLYLTDLIAGDEVLITNPWETISYRVTETRIIPSYDVDAIRIVPGKDLLTLLTCHRYTETGRMRYLVICERSSHELSDAAGH